MNDKKIQSFTQLTTWQQGHAFVLQIYEVSTNFPKSELYGLVDQMRRSAVSITSNIAEGFSRQSRKEKVQFYFLSLGSLTELENLLLISRDLHYINQTVFKTLADQAVKVQKLLNGLIRSIKSS